MPVAILTFFPLKKKQSLRFGKKEERFYFYKACIPAIWVIRGFVNAQCTYWLKPRIQTTPNSIVFISGLGLEYVYRMKIRKETFNPLSAPQKSPFFVCLNSDFETRPESLQPLQVTSASSRTCPTLALKGLKVFCNIKKE